MARVAINTGAAANDGTGDTLRAAGGVINNNFLEVYTYLGAGSTTTLSAPVWSTTSVGINTLRNVGIGTTNPRFALEVGAVGASGTTLFVNGDARITGILTIGTSSITLNGSTNIINVGTGVTINGSTGIISATSIVVGGTTLTGAAVTRIEAGSGISVDQNTGQVTITATGSGGSSQFVTTAAGIHTLSNVGIGTTNPTRALTVVGSGTSTSQLFVTGVSTFVSDIVVNDVTVGRGGGELTNTGVGYQVLYSDISSANYNVAIGYRSLYLSTGVSEANTAVGYETLYNTNNGTGTSGAQGCNNDAFGYRALKGNTTGNQNTAVGSLALQSNTSGSGNVAIGHGANNTNTTANYNTSIGFGALASNTTGTKNVAIGAMAGQGGPQLGSYNVLIGSAEGSYSSPTYVPPITDGSNQLVIGAGYTAWIYGNSSYNVGIGTTNPTSTLTVQGDLSVTGVSTFNGRINGSADGILFDVGSYTGSDVPLKLWIGNSGSARYFRLLRGNGGTVTFDNAHPAGDNNHRAPTHTFTQTGSEYYALFNNGSVKLYHPGSASGILDQKFETIGAGVTITGTTFTNQLNVSGVSTFAGITTVTGTTLFAKQLNVSGVSTVGVVTGATYFGDASYIVSGKWTLGANGSSDYTFTGIGFTQTTNDPALYLARGAVYEFVNNMGAHPFRIQSTPNGSAGTEYNNGVTNNNVSNGTLRFEIPFNAPNTLYYQCTAHAGMGGTITIYPSV